MENQSISSIIILTKTMTAIKQDKCITIFLIPSLKIVRKILYEENRFRAGIFVSQKGKLVVNFDNNHKLGMYNIISGEKCQEY